MTINTKFNKGQFVFLIYNDQIQKYKVSRVLSDNEYITYEFVVKKSLTMMDKDIVINRSENQCWGSIEELMEFFKKSLNHIP